MYLRGARTPTKLIHVVTGGGATMPPRHAIPMRPSGVSSRRDAGQGKYANTAGQDGSAHHPWRSSLDLVWSYSRSQAYFGDNLMSSPSFVERHWGEDSQADTESDIMAGSDSCHTSTHHPEDHEPSLEPTALSDEESLHEARVRDRGPASVESRNYYSMLDRDMDTTLHHSRRPSSRSKTPLRASPFAHSDSDYDEGVSDVTPECMAADYQQGEHPDLGRTLSQGTSSAAHKVNPHAPLRAWAPYLHDPYHVDERSHLLCVTGGSEYQQELITSTGPKSTFWQSWFNAVNALIGVGILSMPFVFAQCGWLGGCVLLVLCALLTNWSGKLLTQIMVRDPSLQTYADIGTYAFGPGARVWVGLLLSLEMFLVAVALIILFSDSMAALVFGQGQEPSPSWLLLFKVLGFAVSVPTLFLPLSFLSPVSLMGLVSIVVLSVVLAIDGLIKSSAPGSLWDPSPTTWAPQWSGLGLGFGLLMSGFSAHPIIPSLYRDMQQPALFGQMIDLAYLTAVGLYMAVATMGYLMFGSLVSDEVSKDLARTPHMPVVLTCICVGLLTFNPVTKFALALRPIQALFESALLKHDDPRPAVSQGKRHLLSFALSGAVLLTAITFPNIVRVMGFLGAFLACSTCIFGPCLAGMVIFRKERTWPRLLLDVVILGVSLLLCLHGTLASLRYTS